MYVVYKYGWRARFILPAATPDAAPIRPPSPPTGAKSPAPPPLFIQDKTKWTRVSSWCNEHHVNYSSARSTQVGIKVQVTSSQDHRVLTRMLKENSISFHTYTLPEERLLRVVIRGVPKELSPSEVKTSLTKENLPVHDVHRMVRGRTHEPYDMVLVSLDRSEAGKAIFKLKSICHLSGISIEPPRKNGATPQCHRCQLYGHSARNCFAKPRCVKCLGDHATADCKRPKDKAQCDEPPSCVLCGQVGHPANYRGCPKAPRAPKPVTRSQPARSLPAAPRPAQPSNPRPQRPAPWSAVNSQTAFPPLPSKPQSLLPPQPARPTQPATHRPPNPAPLAQTLARPATSKNPAIKVARPTSNPHPAPIPGSGAAPNPREFEYVFAQVGRFASIASYAEMRALLDDVRASQGNAMALCQIYGRYGHIFHALENFRLDP